MSPLNLPYINGSDWLVQINAALKSLNNITPVSFVGAAAAGPCTLTGAKVGDKVVFVTGVASGTVGNQSASFEAVITVADQIQQSAAGNLSANVYLAHLARLS